MMLVKCALTTERLEKGNNLKLLEKGKNLQLIIYYEARCVLGSAEMRMIEAGKMRWPEESDRTGQV